MIIAMPKYSKMIAPCFETATDFLITVVEDGRIILSRQTSCEGCEGFGRVSLLKENNVDILICGGIKTFYQNILLASGIDVVAPVSADAEKAVELYLAGNLCSRIAPDDETNQPLIPLDDLICWSKDIFSTSGFRIFSDSEHLPFPVDFMAEIDCPICNKSIMLAICCGAHVYKAEYELREFERVSRSPKFHARIYIHPNTGSIRNRCDELGIELIDPFEESLVKGQPGQNAIPLLKTPIIGHEHAFSEKRF